MNIIKKIKNAFERFQLLRRVQRGQRLSDEEQFKLFEKGE